MFFIPKDKVEAAALKLLQAIKDTGELPTAGRFSLRIEHEISFKPPGEPKVKKTYTITVSEAVPVCLPARLHEADEPGRFVPHDNSMDLLRANIVEE